MTLDDIIRMARKAGCPLGAMKAMRFDDDQLVSMLIRFGRLVAEHERDECAKVCEAESSDPEMPDAAFDDHANGWAAGCDYCAKVIRARGKHESR